MADHTSTPQPAVSDGPGALSPRRRRLGVVQRIRLLILAMALVGGLLFVLVIQHQSALRTDHPEVPFPALVLGFALTEVLVVHIRFRKDTHTFSLGELPLVIGLWYASPATLVLSQLVGAGLVLTLHRRQPLLKLGFNLAKFSVEVAAAIVVLRLVVADPTAFSGWALVATILATTVAALVGVVAVSMVIAISEGSRWLPHLSGPLLFGVVTSAVTASMALAGTLLFEVHPSALALLAVPLGSVFVANRAYTAEREQHQSLQFLYDSTRLLHQTPEPEAALVGLLERAREAFRADRAVVCRRGPVDQDVVVVSRVGPRDEHSAIEEPYEGRYDALIEALADQKAGIITDVAAVEPLPVRAYLEASNVTTGMLVPLRTEDGILGFLLVADRLNEVSPFDEHDLRLAETLGSHLAVSVDNGRLERSVERLQELERQLSHQATHDALTGLPNRTLFVGRVRAALADRPRAGLAAVLFVDLDDFKTINDSLGHEAGDMLLVTVAERIKSSLRSSDVAARLGGDEFAVLLPQVNDDDEPGRCAARLLAAVSRPVRIHDHELVPQASVGWALAEPDDDVSSLLRNADTAMYTAKNGGKHRHQRYHPSMHEEVRRRHQLSLALSRAAGQQQLVVHYQPIVAALDGRPVAMEALVRWQHPTYGLLGPATFISLAEQSGAITDITRFVLDDACRTAADLAGAGHDLAVAVNLSLADFRDGAPTDLVIEALSRSGLPPSRLILEITESLALDDLEKGFEALVELRRLGVALALDDFGTGYSSLAHLQHLPLDVVKLAQGFVDGVGGDPRQDALFEAVVDLGRVLDLRIVSEGVEREEQLTAVRRSGCDLVQGFLLTPALARQEFESWLRRHEGEPSRAGFRPSAA